MQEEGNVQTVSFYTLLAAADFRTTVLEMGARGEAIKLLGINFSIESFPAQESQFMAVGLSSNPSHIATPPASLPVIMADKAIYALFISRHTESVGAAGVWQTNIETKVIPLFGIIRPRRQVLVWGFGGDSVSAFRAEVFYRPVSLGKTELDTLNLKYGKYRRYQ